MSTTLAEAQAKVRVLGLVESLGVGAAEVEAALDDLLKTLEVESVEGIEAARVDLWALVNDLRRLRKRVIVVTQEVG